MSTPDLDLVTAYVLNDQGRIVSTREPGPSRGPLFTLIRSATRCAWAIRADVPDDLAAELDRLAREEPPVSDLHDDPLHADRYLSLVRRSVGSDSETVVRQSAGPSFAFPEILSPPSDVTLVEDERVLNHNFRGWIPGV